MSPNVNIAFAVNIPWSHFAILVHGCEVFPRQQDSIEPVSSTFMRSSKVVDGGDSLVH